MPVLEARIETERASRYLVQFCKHAAAMGGGGHRPRMHPHGATRREVRVDAEWSGARGTVTFTPWGRCTLAAGPHTLTLRIEAADEDGLCQIRDVVTRDLERFSRRDPLTVTWHRPETPEASAATETPSAHRRGGRLRTILLVVAVVLAIALHLGSAGTLAAHSRWTGMATDVVLALVSLKVALIVLGRLGIRHRKATKTPGET
jgi:hypothetical protein